jgi:hypothetical protein
MRLAARILLPWLVVGSIAFAWPFPWQHFAGQVAVLGGALSAVRAVWQAKRRPARAAHMVDARGARRRLLAFGLGAGLLALALYWLARRWLPVWDPSLQYPGTDFDFYTGNYGGIVILGFVAVTLAYAACAALIRFADLATDAA